MDELLQLIRSCTQDLRHAQTNQMKAIEPKILLQLVLYFFDKIQKTNISKDTNTKSLFSPLKTMFQTRNFVSQAQSKERKAIPP
jgi:hypothetical protein